MTALLYFILFVAMQILAGIMAQLLSPQSGVNATRMGEWMLVFEGLLSLAFILHFRRKYAWFGHKIPRQTTPLFRPRRELTYLGRGLRSPGARMAFAAVAAVLWSFGLSLLMAPLHLPDGGMGDTFSNMKQSIWCLLLLGLVGPLCEELVFRPGIMGSLMRRYRLDGRLAAVIASLAFALVHGNLAQGIPAFIIGTVLGLMYLRTHDLRLCLTAHVANNVFGLVLLFFPHMMDFTDRWSVWAVLALGVLHVGLAVLNTYRALR